MSTSRSPVVDIERHDPSGDRAPDGDPVALPPALKTELRRLLAAILVQDFRDEYTRSSADQPEQTEAR